MRECPYLSLFRHLTILDYMYDMIDNKFFKKIVKAYFSYLSCWVTYNCEAFEGFKFLRYGLVWLSNKSLPKGTISLFKVQNFYSEPI